MILTILGAAGALILIAFAVMAPGEVSAQSGQFNQLLGGSSGAVIKGEVESGLWLSLLAMAAAGGFSFFLRNQRIDASAPLTIQQLTGAKPGLAAPTVSPYTGMPVTPVAPMAPMAAADSACPACGSPSGQGDVFCKSCGGPLGGAQGGSTPS